MNVKYDYDNAVGTKINRWTIIKEVTKPNETPRKYICKCECGTEVVRPLQGIFTGNSKSCGCLKIEQTIKKNKMQKIIILDAE